MFPLFAGLSLRLYLLLFAIVVHSRLFSIASSFVSLLLICAVFISSIMLMLFIVIRGSSDDPFSMEILSSSIVVILPELLSLLSSASLMQFISPSALLSWFILPSGSCELPSGSCELPSGLCELPSGFICGTPVVCDVSFSPSSTPVISELSLGSSLVLPVVSSSSSPSLMMLPSLSVNLMPLSHFRVLPAICQVGHLVY